MKGHMADEQIMNLSPEEDLTSVRERLRRERARRIILVVPPHTLLRSHVSWRVLYGDAIRLKKEVQVISTDHQIRSVVKAAGFRVDSPATSSSDRLHPSKFGRTQSQPRTSRTPPARNEPSRSASERRPNQRRSAPLRPQHPSEQSPKQQKAAKDFPNDDPGTGGPTSPLSSTFEVPDKRFGPDFQFSISTPNSVRPVTPEPDNVDDDYEQLRSRDYEQAQSIWEAANSQPRNQDTLLSPEPRIRKVPETPFRSQSFDEADDPLASMADTELPPLQTEQRGHALVEDIFANTSNIADYQAANQPSTVLADEEDEPVVGEIVDQGDLGDFVQRPPSQEIVQGTVSYEGENDIGEPADTPRFQSMRSPTGRSGRKRSPYSAPQHELDDTSQPVYTQMTRRNMPQRPPRQSSSSRLPVTAGTTGIEPQSITIPPSNMVSPETVPPVSPRPRRPIRSKGSTSRRVRPQHRSNLQNGGKGWAIASLIIVLLGLIVLILGFTVPSANVSVTLASTTSKSQSMTFTATATSRLDIAKHTLTADLLAYNSSVQGTGQATGKTTIGTVPARGTETFTNNSSQPVHIPTGTLIATSNGIQFVTTADALVLTGSNNTSIIPIQAQAAGTNGNVGANTITVIPSSSTSTLQQINNGHQINLSITNPGATSGGGTGTAITVSQSDVSREQAALAITLQNGINDFLKTKVQTGDQLGKPVLNETSVVTPTVGTIVNNGRFNLKVNLHMTVLIVRATVIQNAAAQEINETLKQQKPGYALVPQQTLQLTNLKNSPASDGNSMKLTFDALGQMAPQIAVDTIRAAISGKFISDARTILLSGQDGFTQVKQVAISISPSFFPWVPFMQQHINVHFRAVPSG